VVTAAYRAFTAVNAFQFFHKPHYFSGAGSKKSANAARRFCHAVKLGFLACGIGSVGFLVGLEGLFMGGFKATWLELEALKTQDKPMQRWDATLEGVMARGRELGIEPNPGETEGQYRERVRQG